MDIKQLLQSIALDWARADIDPDSYEPLDYSFDLSPERFLEFAKSDIQGHDDRALINALSNSKRAIDCQVDKTLHCVGIGTKRNGFPFKAETLRELGLVAPGIIRKVITKRNYLEHEYKLPQREEVEDAIDIAELFIESSTRTLDCFLCGFSLGNEGEMFDEEQRFKNCVNVI